MLDLDCGCQDGATCTSCTPEPINPFTGLKPHFGMMLGVEDLQVAQGYAVGKLRLHNAWLQGGGVVWGMDVKVNDPSERPTLRVEPGLALDAPVMKSISTAPSAWISRRGSMSTRTIQRFRSKTFPRT